MDEDDVNFQSASSMSIDSETDSSDDDSAPAPRKRGSVPPEEAPLIVSFSKLSVHQDGDADGESDASSESKPDGAVDESFETTTTAGSPERL